MRPEPTYKIAVIDDEPHARDVVRQYFAKVAGIFEVCDAADGCEGVELVVRQEPDIVFLDIQMPGMSGFEVAEHLTQLSIQPVVVFSTAFEQYAVRAFDANAIDYLLKPYEFDRFKQALDKAIARIADKTAFGNLNDQLLKYISINPPPYYIPPVKRLFVKETRRSFFIPASDIIYLEASNYYTTAFMQGGRKHLLSASLGLYEKKLDPANFVRIHKSHIVNLDFVTELLHHFNGEYIVVMQDNTQLKLSRNYKDNLKNLLT